MGMNVDLTDYMHVSSSRDLFIPIVGQSSDGNYLRPQLLERIKIWNEKGSRDVSGELTVV